MVDAAAAFSDAYVSAWDAVGTMESHFHAPDEAKRRELVLTAFDNLDAVAASIGRLYLPLAPKRDALDSAVTAHDELLTAINCARSIYTSDAFSDRDAIAIKQRHFDEAKQRAQVGFAAFHSHAWAAATGWIGRASTKPLPMPKHRPPK